MSQMMPLQRFFTNIESGNSLLNLSQEGSRLCSKLEVFLEFTGRLAGLSTCKRSQVGCVIVTPDLTSVCAIGYNGPPSGEPNDACRGVQGGCGCQHSESNALIKLQGFHQEKSLLMISSLSPCEQCAGLIVNSKRVGYLIYSENYRDVLGLALVKRRGVLTVEAHQIWMDDRTGEERGQEGL